MMMWWNSLDNAAVSVLNENLVISYWFPGDERRSGLCLVGVHKVDESLAAIFDFQRKHNKPMRVRHVPEAIIENMQYPELFTCRPERAFDEYIIPISHHYPMSNLATFRKMRIRRFLSRVSEDRITVREVDMDDRHIQKMLSLRRKQWRKQGTINQSYLRQEEAFNYAIRNASAIGVSGIGLYIDEQLEGFCLFQRMHDKRYITIHHAGVSQTYPKLFDYMLYVFAKWFNDQGIQWGNIEMDMGIPTTRLIKMAMRPANFFRKYTIEPVKNNDF
jgi:hypothetical protein